jgi:anionic cell wall polymer biosynthesis LytR-Cps2A-Psr (LCP) family protein
VDFAAFKQTVNSIGGVTFNVPETLYDPTIAWENHGNSYIAMKGMQTFNGDKALLYARSRETSSDFARGQRQRQLIVAIKDKHFHLGHSVIRLKFPVCSPAWVIMFIRIFHSMT